MKPLRFLVSGGTGFLGNHVTPRLKNIGEVTLMSRSSPEALRCDLTVWDGNLCLEDIKDKFDVFVHMAGLYHLRVKQVEAYKQNVMTTHVALTIAQKARIPHFVHISTIGVTVGRKSFLVEPDDLDTNSDFPDHYSGAKAMAETMVRHWTDWFESRMILRLGVLVGDTSSGKIIRIDGPYHAAQSFRRLKTIFEKWPGKIMLPGKDAGRLPLVPVDTAAEAIVRLCEISRSQSWKGLKSFHITPREGLPARELYESTLKHYGLENKKIHLLNRMPNTIAKNAAQWLAQLPKEEVEYLLNFPPNDNSETRKYLGEDWCPEFGSYEDAYWRGYEDFVSNS